MLEERIKSLNRETSEQEFVDLIDTLKVTNQTYNTASLVDLLSERHPLYKKRSSISSQRMRGYLIEAFYHIGMPPKGLPYLLEELETSFYPYIVTAAARAIRGLENPHPGIAGFLNKSIYNIWQGDAICNYSSYLPPYTDLTQNTSAMQELFTSLQWMGGKAKYVLPDLNHLESNLSNYLNADNQQRLADCIIAIEQASETGDDCCTIPSEIYNQSDHVKDRGEAIDLSTITLQDQDGKSMSWDTFFKGKYTVLSFFYTQCHNPRKCIQTIYNLVDIQELIKDNPAYANIQTAAITYDPVNDNSSVLKNYGNNRRYNFDSNHRMFRVSEGMESLIEGLDIGVNYKGSAVNVHRIEVYIINPEGKIEKSFLRFQAKSEMILQHLDEILGIKNKQEVSDIKTENPSKVGFFNKVSTTLLPVLIAFFPKCPMCWAAYMNLIGLSGIVSIKHQPWLIYVFVGLTIFNLFNLYRLSKRRNGLLPFYLACIGSLVLGVNYLFNLGTPFIILGIGFTLLATLLNSLSFKLYHKMAHHFQERWLSLKYAS